MFIFFAATRAALYFVDLPRPAAHPRDIGFHGFGRMRWADRRESDRLDRPASCSILRQGRLAELA
jgi:hypothetical protein